MKLEDEDYRKILKDALATINIVREQERHDSMERMLLDCVEIHLQECEHCAKGKMCRQMIRFQKLEDKIPKKKHGSIMLLEKEKPKP